MKLFCFAVHDTKAEYFSTPFFTRSIGEALRGFEDEVNNPQSQLNKHPMDFHLYHVGTFDQEAGMVEAQEPFHYGSANDYIRRPELHQAQLDAEATASFGGSDG